MMLLLQLLLWFGCLQATITGGFIARSPYSINTTGGLQVNYVSNRLSSLELFIDNQDTGANCPVFNNSAVTILAVSGQCDRRVGINDRSPACALSVTGDVCVTSGSLTVNGTRVAITSVWYTNNFGVTQTFTPSLNQGDVDIAFIHSLSKALVLTQSNLTADYGNARGAQAIDFQMVRNASNQVAAANQSAILSGQLGRIGVDALFSLIGSGYLNACLSAYCFIGGGQQLTIQAAQYDVIVNGFGNSISVVDVGVLSFDFIGTGQQCSITGMNSAILVGTSCTNAGTRSAILCGASSSLGNGGGNVLAGDSSSIADQSSFNLLVGSVSRIFNNSNYNLVIGLNNTVFKSNNIVIGRDNSLSPAGTNGQTAMQLFGFGLKGGVTVNLFTGFGQFNNVNLASFAGGEERVVTYGIGGSDTTRSNLFSVTNQGNFRTTGNYFGATTPGDASFFEHVKGTRLPPGTPVSLNDDGMIEECLPDLDHRTQCFGVTTEVGAGFVGEAYEEEWHGKYERTVHRGEYRKRLSPKFDPYREYIARSARDEWHIVFRSGLVEILDEAASRTNPRWRRLPGKKNPPPVKGYTWWLIGNN